MKLVTTKIISSLLCIFLMTQRLRKFFFNTEIWVIYLQQLWALWALSVQIAYGTITTKCLRLYMKSMIMVWQNRVALWRYAVGCVLTHGFCWWDMVWNWPNQHPYWMQQNFLKHVGDLLKLQDIRNSCQINCLVDQFCRIWLLKRTKNGLFQVNFDQILGKNYLF